MIFRFLLVLTLLACGCGCSPFQSHSWSPGQPGLHLVESVPFRAQESRDDCGPAALASLLDHRGRHLSVAEVTRVVYTPALGGTLLPDLENFARSQGFSTRSGRGDLALLRRQIDAGRPVLIPVETGIWVATRPHYLVVFGYGEQGFLAHAGTLKGVFVASDDLLDRWEKMNRLYLYLE